MERLDTAEELREYLVPQYGEDFIMEVKEFLDALRLSGVVNMYGAVPYLCDEFYDTLICERDAKFLLLLWMREF